MRSWSRNRQGCSHDPGVVFAGKVGPTSGGSLTDLREEVVESTRDVGAEQSRSAGVPGSPNHAPCSAVPQPLCRVQPQTLHPRRESETCLLGLQRSLPDLCDSGGGTGERWGIHFNDAESSTDIFAMDPDRHLLVEHRLKPIEVLVPSANRNVAGVQFCTHCLTACR